LHQSQSNPLPELDKEVVYIDQFAISNMMKAVNPATKAYRKGSLDPFFRESLEVLHRLSRMQLLICPSSFFHEWESLPSGLFEALKECYELLSCGVHFFDPQTIRRFQIVEHAKNWLEGTPEKPLQLEVHSVITGRINAWPPIFGVRANMRYGPEIVEQLIGWRNSLHQGLTEVFERWRRQTNKQFEDWFDEEATSYGRVCLEGPQLEANTTVDAVQRCFEEAGVPSSKSFPTTVDYFLSPHLKYVPSVKISSMLYAAIARKAAAGQKRPPNRGMANDIEAISVLLPYCDAMFIDKECHALLREKPLCDAIDYGTLIFSLNNKQDFLDYLNRIRAEASESLLANVAEVYGDL
jgi:hypothetical protein